MISLTGEIALQPLLRVLMGYKCCKLELSLDATGYNKIDNLSLVVTDPLIGTTDTSDWLSPGQVIEITTSHWMQQVTSVTTCCHHCKVVPHL